jgi:hypothetical protein
MSLNQNLSEASLLIQYETALSNAVSQPEISGLLTEFGYDDQLLKEGKQLLTLAKTEYARNKQEDDETRESALVYKEKSRQIYDQFRLDRKKARVVFRKSPEILEQLACASSIPNAVANRIATYEKFYNTLTANEDLKTQLQRLKITDKSIKGGLKLIEECKQARIDYYRELGESEQTTKDKDFAISKLDDWMREFYMVAKIALEDNPQLMEALGRSVKS